VETDCDIGPLIHQEKDTLNERASSFLQREAHQPVYLLRIVAADVILDTSDVQNKNEL